MQTKVEHRLSCGTRVGLACNCPETKVEHTKGPWHVGWSRKVENVLWSVAAGMLFGLLIAIGILEGRL